MRVKLSACEMMNSLWEWLLKPSKNRMKNSIMFLENYEGELLSSILSIQPYNIALVVNIAPIVSKQNSC